MTRYKSPAEIGRGRACKEVMSQLKSEYPSFFEGDGEVDVDGVIYSGRWQLSEIGVSDFFGYMEDPRKPITVRRFWEGVPNLRFDDIEVFLPPSVEYWIGKSQDISGLADREMADYVSVVAPETTKSGPGLYKEDREGVLGRLTSDY